MPKRAGFWIRTVAALIDIIAIFAIYLGVFVGVDVIWWQLSRKSVPQSAAEPGFYLLWVIYSTLEIWTAGTPGKMLFGLRITALDGSPADGWRKTLRWSTKQLPWIASLFYFPTHFVPLHLLAGFSAFIIAVGCLFASNDDHLACHDQWARTAVFWKRSLPKMQQGFPVVASDNAPQTPAIVEEAIKAPPELPR